MTTRRKFYKSAVSGRFVSKAQTKRAPSKTITQSVKVRRSKKKRT